MRSLGFRFFAVLNEEVNCRHKYEQKQRNEKRRELGARLALRTRFLLLGLKHLWRLPIPPYHGRYNVKPGLEACLNVLSSTCHRVDGGY